ncbi:MAG: endonuclease [Bacteroidales bacterium]|nr:endonuclease [Bacteroidales bacterium]
MKRLLTIIAMLLALSAASSGKGKEIKVLYWNIQNGMWSDQGNNYDNFVAFVKEMDPDICIWAEAESRYITDTNTRLKGSEHQYLPWNWDLLAARYGHSYALLCGKRDGFPQVVTSKYPLQIVKRVTGNGDDIVVAHGAGWAKVDLGKGKELNIVTVHTWPHRHGYKAEDKKASAEAREGDRFRASEIKYICEETIATVPGAENQLWLMTGDFNAISSVDNFHYERDASLPAFLVHDYVRANTPYIDLIERFYPGEFMKSTLSGRRIDFAYVTPALFKLVTSAKPLYDGYVDLKHDPRGKEVGGFCHPSDHYPILFTFKLK